MNTTRRQILLAISQLAAATALVACGRSPRQTGSGPADVELLASVAYDILPFPELAPAVYVQAASQVLDTGGEDVAAGLLQLREAAAGTAWKELGDATRINVLTSMQESPFFRTLRGATIQVVLRDPTARAIVGYGGPAIEQGGYLHRGFDDISWLPAAKNQ